MSAIPTRPLRTNPMKRVKTQAPALIYPTKEKGLVREMVEDSIGIQTKKATITKIDLPQMAQAAAVGTILQTLATLLLIRLAKRAARRRKRRRTGGRGLRMPTLLTRVVLRRKRSLRRENQPLIQVMQTRTLEGVAQQMSFPKTPRVAFTAQLVAHGLLNFRKMVEPPVMIYSRTSFR
jgi:hypothetical protein